MEHIAPEDHYASGGQHQQQKKELKKSAEKGENEGDGNQSPGQHRTGSYTGTSRRAGVAGPKQQGCRRKETRSLHYALRSLGRDGMFGRLWSGCAMAYF